MVGGGLVGMSIAWLLQRRGHSVLLLELPAKDGPAPSLSPLEHVSLASSAGPLPSPAHLPMDRRSGSGAALGLLMAQVFHRSSGRAWRLRQRSLELWSQWRLELSQRGHGIGWRRGLLLLAATAEEQQRQQRLLVEKRDLGLALEIWERPRLQALQPALPAGALSGLYSPADGQIDPGQALAALRLDALAAGLRCRQARVVELRGAERPGDGRWQVDLEDGGSLTTDWLVLAAGLASDHLLRGVGVDRPLEPVLGQALELHLPEASAWQGWPGAVGWKGLNLVPRPDHPGGRSLWLGATLEPGVDPAAAALQQLRSLAGDAPAWLERAEVRSHWLGLRAKPQGRPAPLLEQPRPGLLLSSGHHRNGVLLAPVSAEWICGQIESPMDVVPA